MNFEIMECSIETIVSVPGQPAKKNAGDKYVKLKVMEESMFATKAHVECIFVDQCRIPRRQAAIDANNLPTYSARYETIENLPPYRAENSKYDLTSMTVLVELHADGSPKYSGLRKAMDILMSMPGITMVGQGSSAPVAAAAPEEPSAELKAQRIAEGKNPLTGIPF